MLNKQIKNEELQDNSKIIIVLRAILSLNKLEIEVFSVQKLNRFKLKLIQNKNKSCKIRDSEKLNFKK